MDLATEWITYGAGAGPVPAYRAKPAAVTDPLPAVVVIQEAWGVDGHIRSIAERLATAGYLTLAPDLFALGGQRPEALSHERVAAAKAFLNTLAPGTWGDPRALEEALSRFEEPERSQLSESMDAIFAHTGKLDDVLPLVRDAVTHLRADPDAAGKRVGSIGFCMGGGLSGLLACTDPELSAAVIFYGRPPSEERLQGLACPLLGLYGGADPRITDTVPTMAKTIEELGGSFEYHVYPGAPHAFFNDTRPTYRVDAARAAWARVLGFFNQLLAG